MTSNDPNEPKYIDIAEFHQLGFVQEINRRLLHPCGLAFSVQVDKETGEATGFGGIWDYREDPEGIYFGPRIGADPMKAAAVDALLAQHAEARQAMLGYVIQPIASPSTPSSGCEHPDLEVSCDFNRLTDVEGGPVTAFILEVRATCRTCGMPFCFRGMPPGLSHLSPTMSLDALTATLPVHPEDDPTTGIGSPGYSVRVRS